MYRVNEIFYSIQGEGRWTGTPMVFLRLAGCNLHCPFCDTDFSSSREMSASDIVTALLDTLPVSFSHSSCHSEPSLTPVCITGGEPSLQLDDALVTALHEAGFRIHIETNGTRPLPEGIDWITLSPKEDFSPSAAVVLPRADELKLVYTGANDPEKWVDFPAGFHYLQPCDLSENCPADGGDFAASGDAVSAPAMGVDTVALTLRYILSHPIWKLSLQTHKILGIA